MGDVGASAAAIRDIIRFAAHTEITRHTPGKVRLKYSLTGVVAARHIDFDNLVRWIPGVLDAQVRLLSRSVVIDYDPKLLPPELWEELAGIRRKPELAGRVADRLVGIVAANSY